VGVSFTEVEGDAAPTVSTYLSSRRPLARSDD